MKMALQTFNHTFGEGWMIITPVTQSCKEIQTRKSKRAFTVYQLLKKLKFDCV